LVFTRDLIFTLLLTTAARRQRRSGFFGPVRGHMRNAEKRHKFDAHALMQLTQIMSTKKHDENYFCMHFLYYITKRLVF